MAKAQTLSTSLWSIVDAMQTHLEGAGMDAEAVDEEVVRGLYSLFWRRAFAPARKRYAARAPLLPGA